MCAAKGMDWCAVSFPKGGLESHNVQGNELFAASLRWCWGLLLTHLSGRYWHRFSEPKAMTAGVHLKHRRKGKENLLLLVNQLLHSPPMNYCWYRGAS